MKLLSLILSITMFITSVPYPNVYAVGTDDFKELTQQKGFVDKSLFIKEIIDSENKAMLITRPRRWGKSLNMSMLKYFFTPEVKSDGSEKNQQVKESPHLFTTLKINSGFHDAREILNRLLLDQALTTTSQIGQYKDVFQEIVSQSNFQNKEMVLKRFGDLDIEIPELINFIKRYSAELREKFSGINNLTDNLAQLIDLGKQINSIEGDEQRRKAQADYNNEFDGLRQKIENHIKEKEDLKIEFGEEFDVMARHQGKYPTIFLSLKEVKENNYEAFEKQLRLQISKVFDTYPYILNDLYTQSTETSDYAKQGKAQSALEKFNTLLKKNSTLEDLKDGLSFLSGLLYNYHGKKAYVLIDEYDAAPNYLLFKDNTIEKDIQPVSKLISDILSPLCKGNLFVEKVILTGVFDTLYKEAGSGLNNMIPYTILDNKFSDYYGFSDLEIENILISNFFPNIQEGRQALMGQVKKWYNGYTDKGLYTPWAVMCHFQKICENSYDYSLKPKSYWNQSGAEDSLEKIASIAKKLEYMSNIPLGVSQFLLSSTPYQEIKPYSISSIFSQMGNKAEIFRYALISFGYLTAKAGEITPPNEEVRELYGDYFKAWAESLGLDLSPFNIMNGEEYSKRIQYTLNLENFQKAFLIQNEKGVQSIIDMVCFFPNMSKYTFGQQVTWASVKKILGNTTGGEGGRRELDSMFFSKEGTGDVAIVHEFKYDENPLVLATKQEEALFQIYDTQYLRHLLSLIKGLPEYKHIKNIKTRSVVFTKAADNDNKMNFSMEEWVHTLEQSDKLLQLFREGRVSQANLRTILQKYGSPSYPIKPQFNEEQNRGEAADEEQKQLQHEQGYMEIEKNESTGKSSLGKVEVDKLVIGGGENDKLMVSENFLEDEAGRDLPHVGGKVWSGGRTTAGKTFGERFKKFLTDHRLTLYNITQEEILQSLDDMTQEKAQEIYQAIKAMKEDPDYYQEEEVVFVKKSKSKKKGTLNTDLELANVASNLVIYEEEGLEDILSLRLAELSLKDRILKEQYLYNNKNTIPEVMKASEKLVSNQKLLIPLDLYNEHWVGLVVEKEGQGITRIAYIDPENQPIPTVFEAKLRQHFAELAPGQQVIIRQRKVETQKYGNCGPEVVENFVEYLTGQRVSQEAAVLLHSRLMEDHLLNRSTPATVLAAEFPPKPSHEEEFVVLTPEGKVFNPQNEAEIKLRDQLIYAHNGGMVFDSAKAGLAQGYKVQKLAHRNDNSHDTVMAYSNRLRAPFFDILDEKLENQARHYVRTGVAFDTLRRTANIQPAENTNSRRASSLPPLGKSFRASL